MMRLCKIPLSKTILNEFCTVAVKVLSRYEEDLGVL